MTYIYTDMQGRQHKLRDVDPSPVPGFLVATDDRGEKLHLAETGDHHIRRVEEPAQNPS